MKFRFPIVIIDEDYRSENTSGLGIRALAQAIETEGFEVLGVTSYGDLSQFAQQQSRASAFILSIDDEEFTPGPDLDPAVLSLRAFIEEVRRKNADVPIYIYGETKTSRHIPNDILRELHGFIHMFEDTPEFVSRHIIREAKSYLEGVQPPFFKALLDYAEDGSYSWHCPGHSGGVAFLKSPVGQMYHQFYGENMLRADVCNAVEELGQLLDHNGAIGESERNAARIFNADHCFFVTNGTSTSNKIVWHHTVAPDDVVVVDRNCHKSVLHSIIMTGAVPVFLKPTRNHYGIIGPIPQSEFEPATIQAKIKANPLLKGVDAKKVKPRVLTLTQSTYDGVLYNTETIKNMLDGYVANLHFDEAWLPHAAFNPFYGTYHAMGKKRERPMHSVVYATQSIHKLLAGISQASHVLVQDSQKTKLDRHLFNEAYLMHTSTSPQYSIIASCDVAAAMMEPPGGTALVEESIYEALDFRRAMHKVEEILASHYPSHVTDAVDAEIRNRFPVKLPRVDMQPTAARSAQPSPASTLASMPGKVSSVNSGSCSASSLTNCGRSGRGPTKDMSPLRMLISCGSSSRLVRRRKRPSGVTRSSSDTVCVRPVGSCRSMYIVRNL